jgi:acyl-CoA synthetase (AMP-forming)/AMP-acid ligase II
MQSKIISRHFVRKDLEYHEDDQIYYYNDFVVGINKWKNILYNKFNMRPGMTMALIDMNVYFDYCTLYFAAAELGLKILTIPKRPSTPDGRVDLLDKIVANLGKLDLMYYYSAESIVLQAYNMSMPRQALVNMTNLYSRQLMTFADFIGEYTPSNIDEVIFAQENSILVWTTTSGTTGEPKPVEYTHSQLSIIAERNARILGFTDDNTTVSHTANMHHSAILMANFLPAFGHARCHHADIHDISFTPLEYVKSLIKSIKQKQTNKVLLPFSLMLELFLKEVSENNITFDQKLDIVVGGFNVSKAYVETFKLTNINKISSMFASNETLGPLLISDVTHDVLLNEYNPQYIGKPVDDLFQLTLDDNSRIVVSSPSLYPGSIVMDDQVRGNNTDGYIHLGRFNQLAGGDRRINEVNFQIKEVEHIVRRIFTKCRFEIVEDLLEGKLYLAVWEGEIDFEVLNHLMIAKYERVTFSNYDYLDRSKFDSFKLDMPALREYFKNKTTIGPA